MPWSWFLECWVLNQLSLSSFTFIRRLFSSTLLSTIRVVSSEYLRLLIFFPELLFPDYDSSSLAFCIMHSAYQLNKQVKIYTPFTYFFSNLEPIRCSMSGSNCCFLTCIQVSQETGRVVWYFYLLKDFLQFIVIHTVKSFNIANEEVNLFWNSLTFSMLQTVLATWTLVPLPF